MLDTGVYRCSCGVLLRRGCTRTDAVPLSFLAGNDQAWTPLDQESNVDHGGVRTSPQWRWYLWLPLSHLKLKIIRLQWINDESLLWWWWCNHSDVSWHKVSSRFADIRVVCRNVCVHVLYCGILGLLAGTSPKDVKRRQWEYNETSTVFTKLIGHTATAADKSAVCLEAWKIEPTLTPLNDQTLPQFYKPLLCLRCSFPECLSISYNMTPSSLFLHNRQLPAHA